VHKATAAAVLNGGSTSTRVSEATRQRILDAANELRYVPNALARGLNGVRLKSLGVSCPGTKYNLVAIDPYCASVLTGIIDVTYPLGYNITLFQRPWRDARQSAGDFRAQGLDGFLIVAPLAGSDMVSGLSELGVPLVVISTSSEVHNVPAVDVDNEKGVRLAIDHLLGLGHTRIAHIYLDRENASFDSFSRRDTFLRLRAEAGHPVPPQYLAAIGGPYMPAVREAVRAFLALPEPPTAIITVSDWLGLNVAQSAQELGLRVPEDLSVVGFDDSVGALANPPLTTVRQPVTAMAEEATRMLISLVEGRPVAPETILFAPELIIRNSTAVARSWPLPSF
jgi:DNA-binding LacI/PurR family transcriptional regulator